MKLSHHSFHYLHFYIPPIVTVGGEKDHLKENFATPSTMTASKGVDLPEYSQTPSPSQLGIRTC